MKLDSLRRRLQNMEPKPLEHDNWQEIRLAILYALDDFPEAKLALASKLIEDRPEREWPELRMFVLASLDPFPAARQAVIQALEEAGA